MGQDIHLTSSKAESLLNGKKTRFSLISKNGNSYNVQVTIKNKPYITNNGRKFPDFNIEFLKSKK